MKKQIAMSLVLFSSCSLYPMDPELVGHFMEPPQELIPQLEARAFISKRFRELEQQREGDKQERTITDWIKEEAAKPKEERDTVFQGPEEQKYMEPSYLKSLQAK